MQNSASDVVCFFSGRRGYNIGTRLIDEFLAKAQAGQCGNFAETGEVIAKVGFKMFLGVTAEVVHTDSSEFSLQVRCPS